jgi:hypothetical protein
VQENEGAGVSLTNRTLRASPQPLSFFFISIINYKLINSKNHSFSSHPPLFVQTGILLLVVGFADQAPVHVERVRGILSDFFFRIFFSCLYQLVNGGLEKKICGSIY